MKRGLVLALAATLSACSAPAQMQAAEAAEMLSLFSAGRGPANVCSANGRALLRGAVRSYSREMDRSGVTWPAAIGGGDATSVDTSVMIAFAAGFIKASDFRGRPLPNQLALSEWPEIRGMRLAVGDACDEVMALHSAVASFVLESARMDTLAGVADSVVRQSLRVRRAREQMLMTAAAVEFRINQTGS
ncbi:MAG: hypothetical protein R3C30_13855 [Hyphomonadaceae bacterium]